MNSESPAGAVNDGQHARSAGGRRRKQRPSRSTGDDKRRRPTVMLWGTGDEPFNLTTVEDTARFIARITTDPTDVSGVHYLSGVQATFNAVIEETERITGTVLTRNVLGSTAVAGARDDLRMQQCRCEAIVGGHQQPGPVSWLLPP